MTGVEILVHNLSHSDLVLDINNSKLTLQEKIVARPKFSHFRAITEAIYSHALKHNGNFDISEILPYSRERREHLPGPSVPIGFNFRATPVPIRGLSSLRFKQDGAARVIQSHHHNKKNNNNHNNHNNSSNSNCSSNSNSNGADDSSSGNGMDLEKFPESCYDMKHLLCLIEAAHFPLIGALLKKWLNNILERGHADTGVKKVLVLVSGRGTASDFDANMADNSTEFTAKLIELFVRRTYPSLELRLIHSHSNLFRYDENIVFVKRELVPVIDSYRSTLVDEVKEKWKDLMRVTLSFADGSSARISAINASLKHYRPIYMHFWQLKSFWRERKLCDDDIEYHTYEEIATEPAISIDHSDPLVKLVVDEVIKFRDQYNEVIANKDTKNDLHSFWLRKTRKPVLAVLLIQKGKEKPILHRGMNMEVSMPTGSLCAERNAIGIALASDITLKRQDIKMVAVYSAAVPYDPNKEAILCHPIESQTSTSYPISSGKGILIDDEKNGSWMKTAESVGNLVELGLTSTSVSEFLSPSASEPHERHEVSRSSSVASATGVLEEKADAFTRSPSQVGMKRKIMTLPITSPGRSPEGLAMATTKTFVDEKVLSLSIKEVQIDMPITKKRSPSLDAVSPSVLTRSRSNTPRAQPLKANVDGVLYPSGALSEKLTKSVSKPKMVVTFSPPLERNSLSSNSLQDFSVQSYEQRIDNNSSSVDEVDTAMSVPSVSYITVDENDMNPLKPCGACHEWLKKISEVNPELKIITFTDAACKVTATAGVSTSSLSIDTSPSTDYNSNSHNTDNHWEGNSNSDNNSDSYNDSLLSGSGFNSPEVSVNTAITGSTGNSGSTERKQRARSMIVIDRLSPVRGDHTLKDLLDLSNGDYNYNYDNNGNYNSSPSQAVRHRADGSIFIQNSSSSKIFIAERAVELKAVEKVFRSWRKVHQHRVSMKNSMIASAKRRATISGQTMAVSVAAAISGNAPTTNIDGVSSIASQAKPNLRKVGSSPLASTPAKRLSISSSTSAILGRAGLGANSTTNVNTNSNSNNRSGSTIRRRLSMTAAQPTKPLSSPTISVGSSISSKGGASSHSSHVSGNTVKNNTRPSVVSSPKTGTKQTAESIVKAPLANKFDSDKSIIKVPNGTTDCNSSIASCKPTVGIIKQSTPTDVTSLSMSSLSAKAAGYSSKLGERKSVRFSIEDGTKSTPQVDTAPKTPATASTSTQLNPSKRSNSFTSPTNTDATDFKARSSSVIVTSDVPLPKAPRRRGRQMAWVKTLVSSPTMNTESQLESETDSETTHEPVNVEEINSVRPFAELFKEELARSVSLDNPILGLEGQSPGSRRRFSAFGSSRRNDSLQNNGTTPMKSYQKLFGSLPDVESENNTEREISNSIVNSHADSSASTKNVSRNYFSDDDNDSPASNDSNNSFNSLPDSAYHITKAIYLKRFKYRIKLRSKRASYNNATLEVAKFRFKISLSMKYVKKWFRFKVDHKEYSSFLVSIRAFSEEKALSRLLMNWFVWTKQRSDNAVGSKLCIDQVNRAKQKSALKALKIHTTYRLGCKVLDDDRAEVKHYKRYRLVSSLASLYDNITFRQTAETVSNTAGEYYRFVMIRKLFNVWNRRISERISRQKALIQVESDIDSAVDSEKESILDIPFDAKVQQPSLNASPESSDSGSEMERAEDMNSDYNSKSVSESGFDSRSYQIDETSDGNSNSSCSPVVEEVHDEVPDIVEQNDCESLPPPPPYEDEIFPLPEVELSDGGSGKAVHEKVYDLKSSYSFDIGYSGSYDDFGSSFGSSSAYNYGSRNLFDSLNSHTSISTFGSLGNSKILYSRKADEKVDLFYRKNCSERSLLHLYLYKEQKKKCSIDILKAIEYNFLKKVSDALDVWSNYQLTKHSMKEMNYYCKSRSNRKTLTHAFHKFARFRGDGIKRSIIYYNRKKVSDGLTTIYKFYIVNQSQYNKYRKGKQYFFYTKGKKYLTIWRARVALNLQRTSSKPLKGNLSYYQSQKLCQAFDRIRIFISYTKSYRLQLTKADCISERKIQKKYFKLWCTFLVNELLEKEQVTLPSPEPVCSESCIEGNFEVLQTIANASEEIVEEIVYDSLIGTLEEINQSPSCDYPTINRMPAVSDDSIIDEDTVDYTYEFQLSANATFSRSSSDVKDAGDTQVSPGSNTEVYDVSTSYSPNSSLGNSATSNSALSSSKRLLESRSERIAADYYRDALMIKGLARLQQFYQRVLPEKILVEDMDDYYIIRLKFQSFQLFIARTLRSRRHQMI